MSKSLQNITYILLFSTHRWVKNGKIQLFDCKLTYAVKLRNFLG